jgi:hypothetical protein
VGRRTGFGKSQETCLVDFVAATFEERFPALCAMQITQGRMPSFSEGNLSTFNKDGEEDAFEKNVPQ